MHSRSPFAPTPVVKGLLAANALIYFLTITVFTGRWFVDAFGFQPHAALARPWTAVTYMFLHGSFLHVAFNMLMLFFFGPRVEERIGARSFAVFYLVCGLGGAILSLGLLLTSPVGTVVGASAAVLGVALAFAMFWPDAPIFVFPLPVPIKAKWLVTFLAAVNLIAAVSGTNDGIAYLAHVGGLLAGFLYLRISNSLSRRTPVTITRTPLASAAALAKRRNVERAEAAPERRPRNRALDDEVDRVLDKISASGLDSLTPGERRLLDEVSRHLRQP
jgi:membrane associated rhomboid family serine protease